MQMELKDLWNHYQTIEQEEPDPLLEGEAPETPF